jgi:ubiquinone/menaquinone biosynthesis C-methylase UbiE
MEFKEWKDWWIKQAPTYFTDKIWQFSQPQLIERLEIQKDHFVLEIGFGYGREISQFCKLSDNVFGLELTELMCQEAKQEMVARAVSPLPVLLSCNGKDFPFFPDTFHVIYSCFVIQHLSREHAKDLIKESLRVLRPDGKVLFEFFGDPAYHKGGQDVLSDGKHGKMFNNAYREIELHPLVKSCGGKFLWQKHAPVTTEWGNHWICFGK